MTTDCKSLVSHINRIKGQMEALKRSITEDDSCEEVTHLISSISASFESVRIRMMHPYVKEMVQKGDSAMENEEWKAIVSLMKR